MYDQVNFITGIQADRDYGFSVYEKDLYNGLRNMIDLNIVSMQPIQIPVNRTLRNNFSLYLLYPVFTKFKIKNNAINHITTQKNAFILNFINSKKSIVTCHDIIPYIFKEFVGIRRFLFNLSVRGMKKADKVIAISESTKKDLVNHLNFLGDKVEVIYGSVDNKKFRPIENVREKLRGYGFDFGDDKLILYVGLDKPTKNIPTLVRAFYKLRERMGGIKLIKVGGYEWKSERMKILNLIKELNLERDIIFTGHISDEVLPLFYNAADVFVFPSLYEGFGLPPLEAMACGCPVIASNTSSIPEVVGDAGILINPEDVDGFSDSMFNILTDTDLKTKLSKRGLDRVKKFTLEKEVEEMLRVYEEVKILNG